jgi:hypothetical protein
VEGTTEVGFVVSQMMGRLQLFEEPHSYRVDFKLANKTCEEYVFLQNGQRPVSFNILIYC